VCVCVCTCAYRIIRLTCRWYWSATRSINNTIGWWRTPKVGNVVRNSGAWLFTKFPCGKTSIKSVKRSVLSDSRSDRRRARFRYFHYISIIVSCPLPRRRLRPQAYAVFKEVFKCWKSMSKSPRLKRSSSDHGAEALFNSASRFISNTLRILNVKAQAVWSGFPKTV